MILGYLLYDALSQVVLPAMAALLLIDCVFNVLKFWQRGRERSVLLHFGISFLLMASFLFRSCATFTSSISDKVAYSYLELLCLAGVFIFCLFMEVYAWVRLHHTASEIRRSI